MTTLKSAGGIKELKKGAVREMDRVYLSAFSRAVPF